jgi:hypothetical protein
VLPPEALARAGPEKVSPGLVALVGDDAPTRMILLAGAGSFESAHITMTRGVFIECRSTAWSPASIAPVDGPAAPEYCEIRVPVRGTADGWNRKVVMFGGGGFNGTMPNVKGNVPNGPADQPTPLGRGYATFASDSGHQANALGSQDGRSGLNDEAVRNFGGDASRRPATRRLVVKKRYATAPRQGLLRRRLHRRARGAGRHPALAADWDGAIALVPRVERRGRAAGRPPANRALAQPGRLPQPAKRAVLRAAMEACDGSTAWPTASSATRRAATRASTRRPPRGGVPVRCAGGADTGDTCLSDAQINAEDHELTPTNFNFTLASGETQYPGYNVWGADLGITTNPSPLQPTVTFLALGTSAAHARCRARTAPYISVLTDQWIKYSVTRDPLSFNSLSLDPENPGPWASRISELSTQLDTSTDISAFAARGGKLLLAHGLADVLVSTRATEEYYQRLQSQMGPPRSTRSCATTRSPGLGHAVSTAFNAAWDSLTALEQWVREGAPANQVVTDTAGRARPHAAAVRLPEVAAYKGSGDVNAGPTGQLPAQKANHV